MYYFCHVHHLNYDLPLMCHNYNTVDSNIFTAIIFHFIIFHVVYFSSLFTFTTKVLGKYFMCLILVGKVKDESILNLPIFWLLTQDHSIPQVAVHSYYHTRDIRCPITEINGT